MPHIILEHNINDAYLLSDVCKGLHQKLSEQKSIKIESIKTRSVKVESLILADGEGFAEEGSFAHVQLKLLSGRADELKLQMGRALLSVLEELVGGSHLSVEVRELESYSKV